MSFVSLPPWWAVALAAALVFAAVWAEYRRPIVPLPPFRRGVLAALRALVLAVLVLFLFRPAALLPPSSARDAVVPVLVDVSRSMRVVDAAGMSRIARAASLVRFDLLPSLSRVYRTELFAVSDSLAPTTMEALDARGRRSDLAGALARLRERYRGQRLAGIVLVSDGADTGGADGSDRRDLPADMAPVFAVGVGGAPAIRDREIVSVAAGDQRLDRTSVDLQVSTASEGFGRTPYEIRVLAGGQVLERRRVTPSADGSPNDERFTIYPDQQSATVYTVEIPAERDEPVVENNVRRILVSPPGRKRRLLVVEGAPGFEHSFMTRAWASDSGFEVDSVVRKGKNGSGATTFSIQADGERTQALSSGFPVKRADLYAYDAVVIANVEADFFTQAQLSMISDFVSARGGGLLVTGGRTFAQRGLIGTPVEPVLPVELDDRRGSDRGQTGVRPRSDPGLTPIAPNQLVLTVEGEAHPVMRLGRSAEETRQKWSALPALASLAPLGPARPGATVLAVSSSPDAGTHPVIAVQKYGQGRAMVFGGEASWRWRMMMASTDRSYERFWRQASRWLAEGSPDAVNVVAPASVEPGETAVIDIDVRDGSFAPVPDAVVNASILLPDGSERTLPLRRAAGTPARFTGVPVLEMPGAYHVQVEAMRGQTMVGKTERWVLAGANDREFVDPRLNEPWLRRVARATGGRYVRASDAPRIAEWLQQNARLTDEPQRRELWHEPWAIGIVILLLSTEWILRRIWGLR